MSALLNAGLVGAVLFVVTFLVDGATRPGYRPTYHAVSALALGDRGWVQVANFIVCGSLITISGVGIGQAITGGLILAVLVSLFGLALVASGVYSMDPMRGYPPGTPGGTPEHTSRAHNLHDRAGFAVFTLLPAAAVTAAFVLERGWRWYSAATAAAQVVLLLWFIRSWENDHPRTGLVQRAMIITGWTWLALLCWSLL